MQFYYSFLRRDLDILVNPQSMNDEEMRSSVSIPGQCVSRLLKTGWMTDSPTKVFHWISTCFMK